MSRRSIPPGKELMMSVEYVKEISAHHGRRDDARTVAGAHRPMRRADREVVEPERIVAIVAGCDIVDVAYADAEGLTMVPLNFGYEYDRDGGRLVLWMHSAACGRKIDAIRAAGNRLPVAFSMRTDCGIVAGRTACGWGESFKSIVGEGVASIVDDLDSRRRGLQSLMAHQAHMPHVEFTDAQVRSVTVWRIESEHFTAKVRTKPASVHGGHGRHGDDAPDSAAGDDAAGGVTV